MTLRRYFADLLREAMPDFSWTRCVDWRRESLTGLVGALLVIPQAITFAYLAGLPPEYGLYCAVFVGFFASFFGSSPMVGGPNTAVSILLSLTVLPFAGRGSPLYVEYILALSLLVGLIQLCIWLLRGGEIFRYLSPAAIAGIKTGVGVLLITSALEGALGLSPLSTPFFYEKFYIAITSWRELVNPYAVTISAITIVTGLVLRRWWPRSYIIIAVMVGGGIGAILYAMVGPAQSQIELLGHITMHGAPLMVPRVTAQHGLFLEAVFPNAIAIAVLGLAQSLVIARDLKAGVTDRVDLQKEVFAQGISNTLSPFFSTFAGSGSFNRTSIAVDMGARTPFSGLVAALAVVVFAWGLGPVLTYLPMPAIAGVLVLVGMSMIHVDEIRPLLKSRIDAAVGWVTLLTIVFIGLEAGLVVAIAASLGFFVASASKVNLAISAEGDEERIVVRGNLFYASLDSLVRHLRSNPSTHTALDLTQVPYCDSTAWHMIKSIQQERQGNGGDLKIVTAA